MQIIQNRSEMKMKHFLQIVVSNFNIVQTLNKYLTKILTRADTFGTYIFYSFFLSGHCQYLAFTKCQSNWLLLPIHEFQITKTYL